MEILAAVVGSVAGKFVEYTLEPIQRQFGYVISYGSNIQSLREEVKRLDDQISGVQQLVDTEGRNLRDPLPVVQTWLEKARKTSEEIGRFLDTEAERVGDGRCLNGWCPDLKSRYSVSRRAKKKTLIIVQLIESGNFRADQIAGTAAPISVLPKLQGFLVFESRLIIVDKVMKALKDDSINTICICGPGGVGKTTMMYQIMKQVEEEKLFDEVAMAVVSQTPDLKKIQDVIADTLGLTLDKPSEQGRAAQLRARIERINRFLLVLDDVWDEPQFADIGLQLESGYKILITARKKDVFLRSGGITREPTNFEIQTLSEDEAWPLFKEMAGNCCEAQDILPVAKQIVNECGGLPIAIVTVGSTIRSAESNETEWRDALRKLERGRHGGQLKSCIKLSYDYLKCEEHQRFFLLCCLFPEDEDIPMQTLLRYEIGLGLLTEGNYSFQEARNRVRTLVNELSRLFLLLESKKPEHVKMHDVVRDVGISLAFEDKENGLMNTCKYFKKSDEVLLEKNAGRFDPTKLKLFWVSKLKGNIPLDFLEGMMKLNVLSLSKKLRHDYAERPKLPALQFHSLENIQTLCLEYYNLENVDLSEIGTLGSLEILSFCGSDGVLLPPKLGLLTQLRLLDCRCKKSDLDFAALKVSYGVLSGLKQLEELYLGKMDWQEEEKGKEVASVAELKGLCNLTTLIITLPKAHLINPKDLHFEKLARFQINMGCEDYQYMKLDVNLPLRNRFAISLKSDERIDQHMGSVINTLLMKTIEILHVDSNYVYSNSDAEDNNLFDLLQMSLKKGFTGPSPSFSHLRSLKVSKCHSLKYVLPLNVARSLLQLESLIIEQCNMVEEVFYLESISSSSNSEGEGAAGGTITVKLPQLTNLELTFLPNLKSLFTATEVVGTGVGEGECEESSGCSFTLLPTDLTTQLQKLRTLEVKYCRNIEALFDLEKVNNVENATNTILPCLEKLCFDSLPKLKKVSRNGAQACQGFQNLKILEVVNCRSMEHIVGKGEEDKKGAMAQIAYVLFPQLVKLSLRRLPNLTGFFNGKEYTLQWMSMKELILDDCPNMKTFSSVSMIDHRGIMSHDHLFNEDVNSVKLDRLEIKKMDCEIIWHCKTQVAVERMIVSNCHKLKNVLASSSDGIKMAKYLQVSKCDSLEDVFRFDCDQGIDASVLLRNGLIGLRLCDLLKLTRLCNMGIGPHDHHPNHVVIEAALTKGLTALCLHNCPSLQRVFSLSNTTRSVPFPKLKTLHIQNCSMMEEIFANEFDCDCDCGTEAALLSSGLEIFKIYIFRDDCRSPLCVFSSPRYNLCTEERMDDQTATSAAPTASVMTVLFPELKHLMLENNANLKWIFNGIDAYNACEFSLTQISISGCKKLERSSYCSLLNSSKLQTADIVFENQKVNVSNIPSHSSRQAILMVIDGIENLMDWKSTQHGCFRRVRSLELQNLLNFPAAFSWLHFLQSLPELQKFHISNCGSVEVIFGLDQVPNVLQLPQLTEIKLTGLDKLACIWMMGIPKILRQRFENIRELCIGQCHSLRNLLKPSMAKYLVNLKTLTVENCGMVKEIVSIEEIYANDCKVIEEIGVQEDEGEEVSIDTIELFPQVENLTLRNLPNVTRFCATQGYTFNLSSLRKVVVSGCPRLELFTLTVSNAPMQDLVATIQPISKKEVTGTAIGEECYDPNRSSFTQCPPGWTKHVQNLRVLEIGSYPSIEVLFDLEKVNNMEQGKLETVTNTILPHLEELCVHDLPKLKHVWNGAQACQFFQNLKILEVRNCGSMEHIVGEGEEEEEKDKKGAMAQTVNVAFPQLVKLRLKKLPNLTDFFNGKEYTIEWMSMNELVLDDCPNMKTFSSGKQSRLDSFPELYNLCIGKCLMTEEIFFGEKINDEAGTSAAAATASSSISISRIFFPVLKRLKLKDYAAATWFHFVQSLPKLERLEISSCGSVEVIFGFNKGLNVDELPLLTALKLASLEKLTCIWMKGIPGLFQRFEHLRELYVVQCHSLRNLLTPSMAKHLKNLKELTVENCRMVHEIVSEEEICTNKGKVIKEIGVQEDEDEEIYMKTISLPQAINLTLKNLPNLMSFCATQGCTFIWPSLAKVVVSGCPRLETFTLAFQWTPYLKEVETQSKKYPLIKDLNATIQCIFKEKGSEGGIEGIVTQEESDTDELDFLLTTEQSDEE